MACLGFYSSASHEHKGAWELLKTLVLKGRVITGDAVFCQRDVCQQIRDDDGHYFFVVKDNQSTLKEFIPIGEIYGCPVHDSMPEANIAHLEDISQGTRS